MKNKVLEKIIEFAGNELKKEYGDDIYISKTESRTIIKVSNKGRYIDVNISDVDFFEA